MCLVLLLIFSCGQSISLGPWQDNYYFKEISKVSEILNWTNCYICAHIPSNAFSVVYI